MTQPSDEEIHQTICDFMKECELVNPDGSFIKYLPPRCNNCNEYDVFYPESLDALVPVVEKLNCRVVLHYDCNVWNCGDFENPLNLVFTEHDKSPSRALALACYKVIKNEV